MSNHSKKYTTPEEFWKANLNMAKYQRIHNLLRLDYQLLLAITENCKSSEKEFNALYRACLRGLFSLIEADVYGLNNLDAYPTYRDRDSFETKFKSTFKQVGKTWNKSEQVLKYLDSKWKELNNFRKLRDELIHPKELEHIHIANESEFQRLKTVFADYDSFINDLMNDFFIEVQIPFL